MSEWITDRRPTQPDANGYGMVLVQNINGPLLCSPWASTHAQIAGVPWMPAPEPPEPYVEPKRVRRRRLWCDIEYTQAFDDDPADFDELIAAAQDVVKDHTNGMNEIHPQNVQRLNEALKPRNEK